MSRLLPLYFFIFSILQISNVFAVDSLKIKDGDSFVLNGTEIRLWGIDAPELDQFCQQSQTSYPCGREAKAKLLKIVKNNSIRCEPRERHYKETRMVAQCYINDLDIGAQMVRSGWALDNEYFSQKYYKKEQSEAKRSKLGVWQGKFTNPYIWRKMKKKKRY